MNYYPFNIGDYMKKTRHLSWDEDMAYRRLIDVYYVREGALPPQNREVHRLALAITKAQREAVDVVLSEFFVKSETGYIHERCDEEIEKFLVKSGKAKASAEVRWSERDAMRTHCEGIAARGDLTDANALRHLSEGNAPNPNPNPNPKEKDSAFEEICLAYPNKTGRAKAEAAFVTAKSKVEPSVLLAAVKAYAATAITEKIEQKYIPHLARWLNEERWEEVGAIAQPIVSTSSFFTIVENSPQWQAWRKSGRVLNAMDLKHPDGTRFRGCYLRSEWPLGHTPVEPPKIPVTAPEPQPTQEGPTASPTALAAVDQGQPSQTPPPATGQTQGGDQDLTIPYFFKHNKDAA